ncbi:wax ester/triacylglycerol synthase domain-containing protein [Streptomyces sp. NPDC006283]|uniref:wax ester/triacylglycerol synthase domain-containing protein n=1 Tax=Streptomyces sp. NPDC006283 TaxID=3156741 RepID=UPI0033AA9BC8
MEGSRRRDGPKRLSADDVRLLALESAAIAGHTLKMVVLGPSHDPLDIDRLRESVGARIAAGSRGRERVALPDPHWVRDDEFDVTAHVRRRDGTAGIDERGAWAAAGELMSERLDHRRPLWALDVVGPLADGREAVVSRIHHAMADGISCLRFLDEVLWEPSGCAPSPPGGAAVPAVAGSRGHELRRLPATLMRELGHRARGSVFDHRIGASRELAFTTAPLAELKAIGASRPGRATVNDVLLASVAGGLRAWLVATGERVGRLRAQVPVSLHHRDEDPAELSNRDAFLNVDLPLAESDPLARLDRISGETAACKAAGDAQELYDLFHALARCPPLGRAVEHIAAGPHEFSLAISNVPGPRAALTVIGRPVEGLYSVAEPAQRHVLRVSAISYAGTVGIGVCTDPEALPGISELADAIGRSIAELRQAAIG